MNIFQEIKTFVSAGKAAEQYGTKINRNKMACCPFHDDRHEDRSELFLFCLRSQRRCDRFYCQTLWNLSV